MIRFSKYFFVYVILSGIIIIPGILSLITSGLKPSIDFTGGTTIDFSSKSALKEVDIQKIANENKVDLLRMTITNSKVSLRLKTASEDTVTQFEDSLKKTVGDSYILEKKETVGPILGSELLSKAVVAAIIAILAILSYVAYAFKDFKYGVAAVAALVHDSLVMFGTFSLLGKFFGVEVDTLFVTAFLTTMSFSTHDTIVIFDRIREYRRRDAKTPLDEISDKALTETMGRSLVNSFTIIFMLLALVLMGGDTIRWFSVALLIGTVTGTYSSPFVATPILILWDRFDKRKKK